MHRPPRPAFKSAQAFPIQLRKIFTPDFFYHDSERKAQDCILISMRDNGDNKVSHQSCNEQKNSECAQNPIKSTQAPIPSNKPSSFHGKSFKIRNYTHTRVKQNTLPIKQSSRKIPITKQEKQIQKKTKNMASNTFENKIKIGLRSYPNNMELQYLTCKLGAAYLFSTDQPSQVKTQNCSIQLTDQEVPNNQNYEYSDWMLIIHQSLITSTNTSNQKTAQKIKQAFNLFKQNHPFVKIVVKTEKEGDAKNFANSWMKLNIPVDSIIYGKQKYVQRISGYDLNSLKNVQNIRRCVVLGDILDLSENYYYFLNENQGMKTLDHTQKYTYLKINGFCGLMKFCQNSVINEIDDEIYVTNLPVTIQTEKYMMMEQTYRKIEIAKTRQNLKKKRSRSQCRSNSIRELSKQSLAMTESKSMQEKNEQFRKKMIQYVKIIQQDNRILKKSGKKQQGSNINFFQKNSGLKLVEQKHQSVNSSKTPYQVIYEIVKNNSLIFKQIFKFQTEIQGADFIQKL